MHIYSNDISSIVTTKNSTILVPLLTRLRFGPRTSQPENVVELRDEPVGNAPESL